MDESNWKPEKIWMAKESGFYNRFMKSCLQDIDIEVYSTHNEGKYAVPERFFRTLKNKIYKYMTSISKKMYIDKLDDIFAKFLQVKKFSKIKKLNILFREHILLFILMMKKLLKSYMKKNCKKQIKQSLELKK